jgi:hypothetical protein
MCLHLKLRLPNVSNTFYCEEEGCSRAKKIALSSKFAQSFKKGILVLKTIQATSILIPIRSPKRPVFSKKFFNKLNG